MQLRDGVIDAVVNRGPLVGLEPRQVQFPEDAAFDALHDEKRRAGHDVVLAQHVRPRYREIGDLEFPVYGMRRLQEPAGRLAAQHVAAAAGFQQVGRVGLPAPELAHLQRAAEALDVRRHVILQPANVEAQGFPDFRRARILILA